MRYLVTLSDSNYLSKGLALYESIKNNTKNEFILYYLCLDEHTYNTINNIKNKNIIAYHLNEIINEKEFLTLSKHNKKRPEFSDYHFALASYITHHLLNKYKLPEILYIDSDIKFYGDIEKIFNHDKSVGIILHRHNTYGCHTGCYNVGVIYFKNDDIGYDCLKWWRDVVMDPNNNWKEKYGTCGDQKYLEAFEVLYGKNNIQILDEFIGHGAPWNFRLYNFIGDNKILWNNLEQEVLFNHFSHFVEDFENDTFRYDKGGEWNGCLYRGHYNNMNDNVKNYYNDYFNDLKYVKEKYKA